MKTLKRIKGSILPLVIAVIVAFTISYFSEVLNFWPTFAITVVGVFINGIIAEWGDKPGGGEISPEVLIKVNIEP